MDGGEKAKLKFYIDGDNEFPTICGTGSRRLFLRFIYDFENQQTHQYEEFTTAYSGLKPGHKAGRAVCFQYQIWNVQMAFDRSGEISMRI